MDKLLATVTTRKPLARTIRWPWQDKSAADYVTRFADTMRANGSFAATAKPGERKRVLFDYITATDSSLVTAEAEKLKIEQLAILMFPWTFKNNLILRRRVMLLEVDFWHKFYKPYPEMSPSDYLHLTRQIYPIADGLLTMKNPADTMWENQDEISAKYSKLLIKSEGAIRINKKIFENLLDLIRINKCVRSFDFWGVRNKKYSYRENMIYGFRYDRRWNFSIPALFYRAGLRAFDSLFFYSVLSVIILSVPWSFVIHKLAVFVSLEKSKEFVFSFRDLTYQRLKDRNLHGFAFLSMKLNLRKFLSPSRIPGKAFINAIISYVKVYLRNYLLYALAHVSNRSLFATWEGSHKSPPHWIFKRFVADWWVISHNLSDTMDLDIPPDGKDSKPTHFIPSSLHKDQRQKINNGFVREQNENFITLGYGRNYKHKNYLRKTPMGCRKYFMFYDQYDGVSISLSASVIEQAAWACRQNGVTLVVKPHPTYCTRNLQCYVDYFRAASPDIIVLSKGNFRRRGDFFHGFSSVGVISVYSSTLYEAVCSNIPAVSYNYAYDEAHQIADAYDNGLWFDVRNKYALKEHLRDILNKGPLYRKQIRARKKFFAAHPYMNDRHFFDRRGKATEQMVAEEQESGVNRLIAQGS